MKVERSQKLNGRKWERQRKRKMNVNKIKTAVNNQCLRVSRWNESNAIFRLFNANYFHRQQDQFYAKILSPRIYAFGLGFDQNLFLFLFLVAVKMLDDKHIFQQIFYILLLGFKQVKCAAVQLPQHALTLYTKRAWKWNESKEEKQCITVRWCWWWW